MLAFDDEAVGEQRQTPHVRKTRRMRHGRRGATTAARSPDVQETNVFPGDAGAGDAGAMVVSFYRGGPLWKTKKSRYVKKRTTTTTTIEDNDKAEAPGDGRSASCSS